MELAEEDLEFLKEFCKTEAKRRVCLQFPPYMLGKCVKVVKAISEDLKETDFFVLADCHGSECCVDFLSARRVKADLIVQFGEGCWSEGELEDPDALFVPRRKLVQVSSETTGMDDESILVYGGEYEYVVRSSAKRLDKSLSCQNGLAVCPIGWSKVIQSRIYMCLCGSLLTSSGLVFEGWKSISKGSVKQEGKCEVCRQGGLEVFARRLVLGKKITRVLLLDEEDEKLAEEICLSIVDGEVLRNKEKVDSEKYFLRRYKNVEKVEKANIIGLLVVGNCLKEDELQKYEIVVKSAGKTSYRVFLGQINEYKLGNYEEIEIFCVFTCAKSSVNLDTSTMRNIVLPYELLVGLDVKPWGCGYSLDHFDFDFVGNMIEDNEVKQLCVVEDQEIRKDLFAVPYAIEDKHDVHGNNVKAGFHGIPSKYCKPGKDKFERALESNQGKLLSLKNSKGVDNSEFKNRSLPGFYHELFKDVQDDNIMW